MEMKRTILLWIALATSNNGMIHAAFTTIVVRDRVVLSRRRHVTSVRQSWSVSDDWSSLSNESPQNAVSDSNNIFNVDIASRAANEMTADSGKLSHDDDWTNNVVSEIYTSVSTVDPPLYDTGFETITQTIEDEMGKEIALLIRCNERPEQMLIAEGRALAPLTDDEKDDPTQLVRLNSEGNFESTEFFKDAVSRLFFQHATNESNGKEGYERILDAAGVAKWMTKSLGVEETAVGRHDRRVMSTISNHGTYGSGRLTEANFQELYLSAVIGRPPHLAQSIDELKVRQQFIKDVWRDLRNHGVTSPVEEKRAKLEGEIQSKLGVGLNTKESLEPPNQLMDECEILKWDDRFEPSMSGTKEGKGADWHRSSHELVELASDRKTPLWLRDGDFVFIDEESCIGCTQCASVAPSSFLMLESGRARTFSQRNTADVDQAVAACPVNCMHRISFRELTELETVRDHGDGRTDHRHMGNGIGHTPLSVAGVGGDASHKDSWYHYVRNKCFMSKQCPQRGCFDCPFYSSPGQNPQWKQQHKEAEHVRAQDFVDRGIADSFRKAADL